MKTLAEILDLDESYEKYMKVKALYDRPGSPGEKAAAGAAMERLKAYAPKTTSTTSKASYYNPRTGKSTPYTDSNLPHGYYNYVKHPAPQKSAYYGPFATSEAAKYHSDRLDHSRPTNTVYHSPNTSSWRNETGPKEHAFDSNAFHIDPSKKKTRNYPDD